MDIMYSLLSVLRCSGADRLDAARTLYAMSAAPDTRALMWQFDCVPLLVQLMHPSPALGGAAADAGAPPPPTDTDIAVLQHAADALLNMVAHQADDGKRQRELQILKWAQRLVRSQSGVT